MLDIGAYILAKLRNKAKTELMTIIISLKIIKEHREELSKALFIKYMRLIVKVLLRVAIQKGRVSGN